MNTLSIVHRISAQTMCNGRTHSGAWIVAFLLLGGILLPEARADYGSLDGRSLVVPGQGITATSRITEVVRFDIAETNTDDLQTPQFDDDGGLEVRRVRVSFANLRGISPSNPGAKIAYVSLWRITQDIDNPLFNFDQDFLLEPGVSNVLIARERVTGSEVVLDVPCLELASRVNAATCPGDIDIVFNSTDGDPNQNTQLYQGGNAYVLNRTVTFFVAIETDATLRNNDQFSVRVVLNSADIAHQTGAGNSFGTRQFGSNVITCVDSAGDLIPFPDLITGGAVDRFYPFEPHNYPDFFGQHPDALDILEDLEIPQVIPSESSRTAVLGVELAGVHSELRGVTLNFISSKDGRNNDGDYWADDPAGIPGVYDPHIDEIIRKATPPSPQSGNAQLVTFDAGDIVLYEGATPGVQTTRRGVDDDGDMTTDEELPNGLDDDGDGLFDEDISFPVIQPLVDEDGQDYWAWFDDPAGLPGVYDPGIDELYFDSNGNGRFDISAGIPQVSEVPELVYAGADGVATLRPGDPYDSLPHNGLGADNTGDGQPDTFFLRLDGDGDGEAGSPLSPNIFASVPSLMFPSYPDNPFIRNPYFYQWPDADGIYDLNDPTTFTGVKLADGVDNNGNSLDYDLALPPIGDPAGPPWGGYEVVAAMTSGASEVTLTKVAAPFIPGATTFIRTRADGVDNNGNGEAESPRDAFGRAIADGVDNDANGLIDEGIDENVDEGINEDIGDNAFNALTTRRNSFETFDDFLGDIDSVILYQDDGDGVFNDALDIPISRHDPEQVDWAWVRISPPVMSMRIDVDSTINAGRGAIVPVTDNGTYDFFVAITLDGDDRGDYFLPGARTPNSPDNETGTLLLDYEGVRPGDSFMVSIARGNTSHQLTYNGLGQPIAAVGYVGGGIDTDAGFPNASVVTKPAHAKLYTDDVIGYVEDTIQGDDSLAFLADRPERVPRATDDDMFVGNPYLDATSSPVGVIGLNVADTTALGDGKQDFIDSVTVLIEPLTHDLMQRDIAFEGTFDVVTDGVTGAISLPDLMPLARNSTGGVGLYRDNPEAGIPGGFDAQDIPIDLREDFLSYAVGPNGTVELTLTPVSALPLPSDDSSAENAGHDYFVTIRTSDGIDYRDAFRVTLPDDGVQFRSGPSVQNSGATTDSIVANVPTILEDLTGFNPEQIVANIPATESGVAAIGVNLYDRVSADTGEPTNLNYILINFANVGGDNQFTLQDLAPIGTGPNNTIQKTDGVAIYRDTVRDNPDAIPGVFDETDQLVRAVPLIGNVDGFPNSVFLFLDPFGDDPRGDYQDEGPNGPLSGAGDTVRGERIPPNDDGVYEGNDYFVVIRPDSDISNGDDFIVQVRPLVNNNIVEWPLFFTPNPALPIIHTFSEAARLAIPGSPATVANTQEVNGVFRLNYSYEAVESKPFLATVQTDTVIESLTSIGETIEANSPPKAVLGIDIQDQGNPQREIVRIDFDILSPLLAGTPSVTISDFKPFSPTPNSGFALYRDNPNGGVQGQFDETDTFLPLVPSGSSAVAGAPGEINVSLTFSPGAEVPDDDLGNNAGNDFFIVVRTSETISFKDQFQVRLRSNGIFFQSGASFGNTTVTSHLVTTNVPVFATDTTGFFGASFGRNDGPDDVIGLNFLTGTQALPNNSNESLDSLIVELNKVGTSSFTNSDLAPLSNSVNSGIALYRDNGSVNGRFDPGDTFIPLGSNPFYTGQNQVFMKLASPLPLPANDAFSPGTDFGPDLFIVLRTSGSITQTSVFNVTVRNIRFVNSISNLTFTTGPIDGGLVNEPPFLELINPVVGDTSNSTFTLRWEDFDPDSNATLDFFYVSEENYLANGSNFNNLVLNSLFRPDGVTRAEGIKEDPDGLEADSFLWDVSLVNTALFPPANPRVAELRVGGFITDGIIDFTATSPSFLTVTNGAPTLNFTNFSGSGLIAGNPPTVLQGVGFNLGFSAKDPEGRATADIYLVDETAIGDFLTPQASALFAQTTRITSASMEALSPGNVFRVNDSVVNVTQSTTISVPITGGPGGLSSQLVSDSARTFAALAHIRDIVAGSREFDNGNLISPQQVRVTVIPNGPPTFAFTGDLAGGGTAFEVDGDNRFQLTWVDSEPDVQSRASIDLFYVRPTGGQQQIIQGLLPGSAGPIVPATGIDQADPNNSFTWDLTGLNAGTYRVRGVIQDEISQAADEAFVVLNRPSAFAFINPTQDRTQFSGVNLLIEWTDSNPDFDDDEQIRFFLRNTVNLSDFALNTTPIPVSDGADRYEASTSSLPPGTYFLFATLTPPPPNSAGLSRTIFAREADNSQVVITLQNNDPPQLVFEPLSLSSVLDANPLLTDPTLGGVVSEGGAAIPVVWTDSDDPPLTATVRLFAATDVADPATFRPLQGQNPPNPGIVGNQLNLATDNGPGPFASRGAFTVGADQDAFFWDVSDPNQVPRGAYAIVAIVEDGINAPVQVSTPNTIGVNRRPTIQFTSNLPSPITRGDAVTLAWTDGDPDSNARIRIFYQLDTNLDTVPDTALRLVPGASSLEEDPEGVGFDTFVFDTGLISPAPAGPFGLFVTITIEDESNTDSDSLPSVGGGVIVNPNDPPSLVMVRPNVEIDQEDPDTGFVHVYPDHLIRSGTDPAVVKIEWILGMDDNVDTTVALYRDNNRFGGDGVALDQVDILGQDSQNLPLVANGVFFWDVSEVPAGDWHIYALIDDGVNTPVPIYSPGFIRVNQLPEFEFLDPDGFDDNVFRGQAYTLSWDARDPDSDAIINLFLDPDTDLNNGFGSNVADLNGGNLGLNIPEIDGEDSIPVNTAPLVAGTYWVVAHVDDGVNLPRIVQSTFPITINATSGAPRITITNPSGGSPTNPLIVSTPIMTVTWVDDPVSDARREQSFIQFFWDTDFFGNNGTRLTGEDVAFDGSVINADRIPVELRPSIPPIAENLRDQDQFRFDVSQFPTGEVLYLYAKITDIGLVDENGEIIEGEVSSEFYQSNAFIINSDPNFRWIVPSQFVDPVVNPRGNPLEVIFEAFDPDSVALIDLFLDADMDSSAGLIPIRDPGQNVREADGVQSVILNLADEVAEASVENTDLDFHILAQITDGVTVTEVYSVPITVTKNLPPTVQVVTPNIEQVVPNEGEFVIEWRDDDPDSEAVVTVFLDFDQVGGSGTIVPGTYETTFGVFLDGSAIPEKEDNGRLLNGVRLDRFTWDLSVTPPGTYFIGVRVEDGANVVWDYSDEPIIVNSPPTLTWINPPPQGANVVQGNAFQLQWEDADDDAATLISFLLDPDEITGNGNEIAVPGGTVLLQDTMDNLSFNTGIINIPAGETEISITPIAILNDGVNPPVTVRSPGQIIIDFNDPPRIEVLEPRREAVLFDDKFILKWRDEDPDSAAVIDFFLDTDDRDADGIPIDSAQDIEEDDETDQLEVDFSGTPRGRYFIYAVIDDGFNRPFVDYAPAPINLLSGTEVVEYAVYLLTSFGDIFSVGNVDFEYELPNKGVDLSNYRNLEVSADGATLIVLQGDGTLTQLGVPRVDISQGLPLPLPGNEYIDIEFTPDERGLIALDCFGNLVPIGSAPQLAPTSGMGVFGMDLARDFELTEDGLGAYILDAMGGVHAFGNAIQFNEFPFFGFDIAKDIELVDGGGYILDGLGMISPLGRAPALSPGADFGFDIARDLLVFPGGGFYILDGQGGITALGNDAIIPPSNEPAPNPFFSGLDVVEDFAPAGKVEITDQALLAMSAVRKFEVAFRNEDLASLLATLSLAYNDGTYLSRTQLINGVFDQFGTQTNPGILDEWADTVDLFGGPLAGFSLSNPQVTFSEDGNTAQIVASVERLGYRGATVETEISVPASPPRLVTFSVEERDAIGESFRFGSAVPTTVFMRDPGDHRGVILYLDKSFVQDFGNAPDPLEWRDEYRYDFKKQGNESFRTHIPGGAFFRIVFATQVNNLPQVYPPDPRPIVFGYINYEELTPISLNFTVRRETGNEWRIIRIEPITELIHQGEN